MTLTYEQKVYQWASGHYLDDDVPNSKTLVASTVRIGVLPLAGTNTTAGKSTQLTIVGNDTGATVSLTISNKVVLSGSVL